MGEENKIELIRNCPECGIELKYKSKRGYVLGIKNNSLCKSCSRSGERHPNFGNIGELSPRYGQKHSPESIKLMSELHIGKKASDETKKLMSEQKKGEGNPMYGKHHSPETLKLISKGNTGKIVSEETKKLMSELNSGQGNPMYGKNHTDEAKKLIAEAKIGTVPTVEQRKKTSASLQGILLEEWKGFKTTFSLQIRDSALYEKWRKSCFERDKYTCQECGISGTYLHVDHIKQFALILKENNINSLDDSYICNELWDINNGRTLCVPCHKKTETYGNNKIKIND